MLRPAVVDKVWIVTKIKFKSSRTAMTNIFDKDNKNSAIYLVVRI